MPSTSMVGFFPPSGEIILYKSHKNHTKVV
jgi:hypothetical protein